MSEAINVGSFVKMVNADGDAYYGTVIEMPAGLYCWVAFEKYVQPRRVGKSQCEFMFDGAVPKRFKNWKGATR
jgi:hypothetical protein